MINKINDGIVFMTDFIIVIFCFLLLTILLLKFQEQEKLFPSETLKEYAKKRKFHDWHLNEHLKFIYFFRYYFLCQNSIIKILKLHIKKNSFFLFLFYFFTNYIESHS